MERDCTGAELLQQTVVLVRAGMKTICNERQLTRDRGSMQIWPTVWGFIQTAMKRCMSLCHTKYGMNPPWGCKHAVVSMQLQFDRSCSAVRSFADLQSSSFRLVNMFRGTCHTQVSDLYRAGVL